MHCLLAIFLDLSTPEASTRVLRHVTFVPIKLADRVLGNPNYERHAFLHTKTPREVLAYPRCQVHTTNSRETSIKMALQVIGNGASKSRMAKNCKVPITRGDAQNPIGQLKPLDIL